MVASTTSTDDTGLFGVLVPAFEAEHPRYSVSVIAVGTGQALAIGRAGDADALLVHSPAEEEEFVASGYGEKRRDVMYNDFVILGSPSDPADIAEAADVFAAFRALAQGGSEFISRGDESGTHFKEKSLWEDAGVDDFGEWYLSVGQGMGETLIVASEKEAYTLADRGTYLAMRERLDLAIIFEGDERLFNPYGVVIVRAASNSEGARAFSNWLVSPRAQELIGGFGAAAYGEALFTPNAGTLTQ